MIQIKPINNFPMIKEGDNIGEIIYQAAGSEFFKDGDVIVIAHTIISRAEGNTINLDAVKSSPFAKQLGKITGKDPNFVEVIIKNAKKVYWGKEKFIITETPHGFKCINAGVDKSNTPPGTCLTLPTDSDKSANEIHQYLIKKTNRKLAVIISDTWTRPFRRGTVNFAIGYSGINPMLDYVGKKDLFGNVLISTQVSRVDELAASAGLVMGQAGEGIPVVIIRGAEFSSAKESSVQDVLVSQEEDFFL